MLTKIKKAPGALLAVAAVMFVSATAAGAEPVADPTGGAGQQLQDGITSWVTTYGMPVLVALMVLGAVIAVLTKFARKARGQI